MSRKTYIAALNEVLQPLGFDQKGKKNWVRSRGPWHDEVQIYTSPYGGTAAQIWCWHTGTKALLDEAVPGYDGTYGTGISISGPLPGGRGRWRNDPDGLARAVATEAPPFFASFTTLEQEAIRRAESNPKGYAGGRIFLALTLYQLGRFDEAREAMNIPFRRTAVAAWTKRADQVREWLERRAAERT